MRGTSFLLLRRARSLLHQSRSLSSTTPQFQQARPKLSASSFVHKGGMTSPVVDNIIETNGRSSTLDTLESNGGGKVIGLDLLEDTSKVSSVAETATRVLREGGVVAVPTDTVYGVAADAQNNEAIAKLYRIKGRDSAKPIAICVSSVEEVSHWGEVNIPTALLEDLLPGPVTLVFERKAELNPQLNPRTRLIGIRVPDHRFIIELAKSHKGPVALTSANVSNNPSTLEIEEFKEIWDSLDLIVDGGKLSCDKSARAGSTVIDFSTPGCYRIIREGSAFLQCVKIVEGKYNLRPIRESQYSYG